MAEGREWGRPQSWELSSGRYGQPLRQAPPAMWVVAPQVQGRMFGQPVAGRGAQLPHRSQPPSVWSINRLSQLCLPVVCWPEGAGGLGQRKGRDRPLSLEDERIRALDSGFAEPLHPCGQARGPRCPAPPRSSAPLRAGPGGLSAPPRPAPAALQNWLLGPQLSSVSLE